MRDRDHSAIRKLLADRTLDHRVGLIVHAARRLIHDEDGGALEERARKAKELALAERPVRAAYEHAAR